MERRSAHIESDLAAAAAAQQWILPRPQGRFGPFSYTGQCRPGEYVGGDFYDVFAPGPQRLALAIGDVSGHGVAASVLMQRSAGFLHAVLAETADPQTTANRLNQFVGPRRPVDRFLTLWVGLLDLAKRELRAVDAGHGYVLLKDNAHDWQPLDGGDIPIGVDEDFTYTATTTPLAEHGRIVLVSDGLVEQFAPMSSGAVPQCFGLGNLQRILRELSPDADPVAALFDAVVSHAGKPTLSDDATAVHVRW